MNPQTTAQEIVGPIQWQSPVTGFCRCPGHALHTHPNGSKDCRVSIDGAPTIYCFHSSCQEAVQAANRRLRRALSGSSWSVTLPGGPVLRSGQLLHRNGRITEERSPHQLIDAERERWLLSRLRVLTERLKPQLFECYRWPYEQILAESPVLVSHRPADEQFRTWLKVWPPHSIVWNGGTYHSGKPDHATHFRSVSEWYAIGAPVFGCFTCGAAFKPGSWRRANNTIADRPFLVVESDTLNRDEVGAIFAFLARRMHFRLHAIVDTAGKSLHGWFDAPATPEIERHLKAFLTVLGCDPKLFSYSQPVRVPGAFRNGRLQRLIWLNDTYAH